MTAAVYSREIRDQYDCGNCAASPSEWNRLGRCVGPFPGGGEIELRMEGRNYPIGSAYPARFDTCPMGRLRADLRPREVAIASLVSHAAGAELDKRWPEIPAKLASLLQIWRQTEAERMSAEHAAMMQGMEQRGPR